MNNYRKNRCIEIARSMQDLRTGRNLHFSFLLKNNSLICLATNDYRHRNLEHHFGKYVPTKVGGQNYVAGRHSECQLLKTYLNRFGNLDMSGFTLFNVRLSLKGETMLAKPCQNCERVLNSLSFKHILWTE